MLYFTNYILSLKFVKTVFVSLLYDCITLSHKIAESSIIPEKDFPFPKLHVGGFQT